MYPSLITSWSLLFLKSALLLTEVLKEREAQLELKRLKEQAMSGQVVLLFTMLEKLSLKLISYSHYLAVYKAKTSKLFYIFSFPLLLWTIFINFVWCICPLFLQDSVWHEQAMKDREEMILKDQEEARKRIKEAKDAAAFQKAQYGYFAPHMFCFFLYFICFFLLHKSMCSVGIY